MSAPVRPGRRGGRIVDSPPVQQPSAIQDMSPLTLPGPAAASSPPSTTAFAAPSGAAATPPAELVTADLATSPQPSLTSMGGPAGSLSSFLESFGVTASPLVNGAAAVGGTNAATAVASAGPVGVVRGRGQSNTPMKGTQPPSTDTAEFKARKNEAQKKLESALSSMPSGGIDRRGSTTGQFGGGAAPDFPSNAISVIPESLRVSACLATMHSQPNSRVLLVETTHLSAIAAFEDAARSISGKANASSSPLSVGLWDGAAQRGDLSSRLVITHVHSFLLLVGPPPSTPAHPPSGGHESPSDALHQAVFGDITHVFFVCSSGGIEDNRVGLRDTGINVLLQLLLTNRASALRIVFVGDLVDLDQIRTAIGPSRQVRRFTVSDFGHGEDEPSSAFAVIPDNRTFTPEESCAIANVGHVAELAPVNGSIPGKTMEVVTDIAVAIVQHLIDLTTTTAASHEMCRLIGVIFVHDVNESMGKFVPAVGTRAVLSTDLHTFGHEIHQALKGVVPGDAGAAAAPPSSTHAKPLFLILASATSRYAARNVLPYVNVLIDFGTERRQGATPKQEYPFLLRQTVATTSSEAAARGSFVDNGKRAIKFLIGRRPTVFAADKATAVVASPTATFSNTNVVVSSSQLSVMDAVLQIARLAIPANPLFAPVSHIEPSKRTEYVELSAARLAELCALSSPVPQAGITFIGDVLGRIPLAIENAVIVLHGMVTGLHDAMALIASVLQCPIRNPVSDPSHADAQSQKWRASLDPAVRCSDAIADVITVLDAIALADNAQRDAFFKERNVNRRAYDEVLVSYQRVVRQIVDYLVDRTSGRGHSLALSNPQAVRADVLSNANFIVFVIGAAHSIKATIVRVERDPRLQTPDRGSLMFLRTGKEATSNSFVPSAVEWKVGNVVVPGQLINSNHKFYLSSITTMAHKYLWASLVLLNPALDFDRVGPTNVVFAVTVNRQTRRFSVDVATSAKLLDAREQYNRLLGCVLLRRSTNATLTSYLANLAEHGIHNIDQLRKSVIETIVSLIQDVDISEVSLSTPTTALARSLHFAPSILDESALQNIAPASDVLLANAVKHSSTSVLTAAPSAASVTAPTKRVAATTINDDDDDDDGGAESIVWTGGGVIEEDGDEIVLESDLLRGQAAVLQRTGSSSSQAAGGVPHAHVIIEDD